MISTVIVLPNIGVSFEVAIDYVDKHNCTPLVFNFTENIIFLLLLVYWKMKYKRYEEYTRRTHRMFCYWHWQIEISINYLYRWQSANTTLLLSSFIEAKAINTISLLPDVLIKKVHILRDIHEWQTCRIRNKNCIFFHEKWKYEKCIHD